MNMARLKTWALDLILPKYCIGCGAEGEFLCLSCRATLSFSAPTCPICSQRNFDGILCLACQENSGLRRFIAPFSYHDFLIRNLIYAYKYEGVRELKTFFADEIVSGMQAYGIRPNAESILVPIPLARSRERERGFNQARLLAEEIGQRISLPVRMALRRTRATAPQIEMESYDHRRNNMHGAFAAADATLTRHKTVILVDDVYTSGATLEEAARVIRSLHARTVWALTIAKG